MSIGGTIRGKMDIVEMGFKTAVGGAVTGVLALARAVIGHEKEIAVLKSQREDAAVWQGEMTRKLDKIIDLHLKANGG